MFGKVCWLYFGFCKEAVEVSKRSEGCVARFFVLSDGAGLVEFHNAEARMLPHSRLDQDQGFPANPFAFLKAWVLLDSSLSLKLFSCHFLPCSHAPRPDFLSITQLRLRQDHAVTCESSKAFFSPSHPGVSHQI